MSEQPSFSFAEVSSRYAPDVAIRVPSGPRKAGGPSRGAEAHRHAHRDRLRQRFTEGGAGAVPDYELLEMILYRALPRGDTKPLAKRLLERFGDLNHVLAAPAPRLKEVEGVGGIRDFEPEATEAWGHRMARRVLKNRSSAPGTRCWTTARRPWRTATSNKFPRALPRPQERADRGRGAGRRARWTMCRVLPARRW